MNIKDSFSNYIEKLQNEICHELEKIDGKETFKEDKWERPEGGGGKSRVISNGQVFEKGGVNISFVHGILPESMQKAFSVEDNNFFACGLSLVIHPKNPFVPTVHANWRYFELYDKNGTLKDSWFGGGADLTPYYFFEEDGKHFHSVWKNTLDDFNKELYPNYKQQCDEYFVNKHRNNEARGIGGIFYDYVRPSDREEAEKLLKFQIANGNSFTNAYLPIVEKRKELPFSEKEVEWQEIRRGRYAEFNLVHDRATLFGLRTNGRIESILM
ncbi:MAG: oxygen-dependent coproporphyrinogen oxidase, partial [Chitinophagaceae bacterium]